MGWFSFSPVATASPAEVAPQTPTPSNLTSDLKPAGEATNKVKPCCVCKEEKSSRDECMLYSQADDPQEDCKTTVDKYKSCMASYGFKI